MGNGKTLGAEVTPEFYDTVENIHDDRDDSSMSETARHLMREGAYVYDTESLAQRLFKNLAIAMALVALIGFLWATQVGYDRPIYFGVVWMIPSVAFLWLHELWPGISKRFGSASESSTPSEA